ncbi:hypothetical protein, partial [Ciceribacter thiooxidans]
ANRADVNVRLRALKLTLCHLNASYDRKWLTRQTGLVPPFKAFAAIAQDLFALRGKGRGMGDPDTVSPAQNRPKQPAGTGDRPANTRVRVVGAIWSG